MHPYRVGVAKQHGAPWRCPFCERPTVKVYRCSNGSCAKDLTSETLDRI